MEPLRPSSHTRTLLLLLVIALATLIVHIRSLIHPLLLYDDFDLLLKAWTWDAMVHNLWVPMNEHAWPITRLWTRATIWLAGSNAALPVVSALANRVLLLLAVGLTYRFVRRERGHSLPGLIAAALFGLSANYQEGVYWFAASPAVGALATGLFGLLAAQRWQQTGSFLALFGSAVAAALAPAWFAGGVLAGPFCSLYLFGRANLTGRGRWWAWAIPILGTVAFLAVSMPRTAEHILHAEHYRGQTAVQAFSPFTGAVRTLQTLVDGLALGAIGIPSVATPIWMTIPLLIILGVALAWWWRRTADRRLFLLGLGFILISYWLIHSARAAWDYPFIITWSRYEVYPQFGLALLIGGGWPCNPNIPLTRRQMRSVGVFVLVLMVIQFPRGFFGSPAELPQQGEALRQIDRVEERCRELRVSAADAASLLPSDDIPGGDKNRWWFLRGSAHPREFTPAERDQLKQELRHSLVAGVELR
jgi:hypothetical protein